MKPTILRKTLERIEPQIINAYRRLKQGGPPNLEGDRDVEYSWIAAHCPHGPGSALDIGAGRSMLGLLAARRGFDTLAVDLESCRWAYQHPRLEFKQMDIFDVEPEQGGFDVVINCSTVEHIGLGRYGDFTENNGDIQAMAQIQKLLHPEGKMLLTIPVGEQGVYAPYHRVYGKDRLAELLSGFEVISEEFWSKPNDNTWSLVPKQEALEQPSGPEFYALGCFEVTLAE